MKKLLRSLLAVMLISMMAISLASCAAKPEKVEDKLKDKGYEVEMSDDADELDVIAESLGLEGKVLAVVAAMGEDSEATIMWFEKKDDADTAVTVLKVAANAMGEYGVAQNGKIVVFGMGDAYDDACDIVNAK